jgi:hypothetical protein
MNHDFQTNRKNDAALDATLHALGKVTPAEGLEDRVLRRLRAEPAATQRRPALFRITGSVFGFSGAAVACALIVVATVGHSHHANPVLPQVAPVTGSGVGTASAAHLPGPQPVTPAPRGHGRAHGKTGAHTQGPAEPNLAGSTSQK